MEELRVYWGHKERNIQSTVFSGSIALWFYFRFWLAREKWGCAIDINTQSVDSFNEWKPGAVLGPEHYTLPFVVYKSYYWFNQPKIYLLGIRPYVWIGDPRLTKTSSLLAKSVIVRKIAMFISSYSSLLMKIMIITNI